MTTRHTSGRKKNTNRALNKDLLFTDAGGYMAHPRPIWTSSWGESKSRREKERTVNGLGGSVFTGVQEKGLGLNRFTLHGELKA